MAEMSTLDQEFDFFFLIEYNHLSDARDMYGSRST